MKARQVIDAVRYWAKSHPIVSWAISGVVVGYVLGKVL